MEGAEATITKDQRVRGYCAYDWGKSAFETSVTTAIFPAWFAYLFAEANGISTKMLGSEWTADATYSAAVMVGALLVAICAPSLGVIADRRMIKIWWLKILTLLGAGSCILLALSPYLGVSLGWIWALIMFMAANVGLNGAGVFYNALLPHMGDDSEMDAISNKAFAAGYLGGGLLLVVHLALVLGLPGQSWVIPFAMATSGLWWLGFAQMTFRMVPEPHIENEMEPMGLIDSTKMALGEVKATLADIKSFRTLFFYMLAYFCFIDGINSVTALAGVFGIVVLGLTTVGLILTILIIQFVAAPAAIGFTKLAEKWGTKGALQFSLVCWCVVIVGALSFAPLELEKHEEYDIQYTWTGTDDVYEVVAREGVNPIAALPDDDEQQWALTYRDILPVQINEDYKLGEAVEWAYDDDGLPVPRNVTLTEANVASLQATMDESRFSFSITGAGNISDQTGLGVDHPTSLGDGLLDFIPETARTYVWAPLGMTVFFQFLLLGVFAGALLGGSQGLARSMFGQMVPETRSAEFFGFFGFFGKVAALLGPLIYSLMTVWFDSRVGIFAISLLIVAGAIMLRRVDVEDGIAVARAEDERNRQQDATTA
ncbi:MAG: MFS transporter [Candidatus Thermoplasmatota archaeon]|nr:MFS transporter [Candidatus Thermoplasmatota archaeon]